MSELVMNQAGTINHAAGSPVSGGVFVITSIPDVKAKAEGSGIYAGPLAFTFSGGNATGFVPGSLTGAGSIAPTATKSKIGGLPVVREQDSVSVTFSGTTTPVPPGAVGTIVGIVEVASAGQTKVKAE